MNKLLLGNIEDYKYLFDSTYHIIEKYNFTLDDAKSMRNLANTRRNDALHVVLAFQIISDEAQNAMLKMLEEENGLSFIIIVPDANILLDTVKSRLMKGIIEINNINNNKLIDKFLKMSASERLKDKDIVALYEAEIESAPGRSIKMKSHAHQFLIDLIQVLMNKYKASILVSDAITADSHILLAKINKLNELANYIMKPGSSAKMIIEWTCVAI